MRTLLKSVMCCGEPLKERKFFDFDNKTESFIYQCSVCNSSVGFISTNAPEKSPEIHPKKFEILS